ncbi:MAG: hypothetical protein QNJ47_24005 [Nostocaceae cyanobacterium]|nr:hypothetical protein [Nostocaceae cyanobacterium]
MKSFTIPDFWQAYAALSPEIKQQTRKAYQIWKENQSHPFLHFKKVGKNLWFAQITAVFQALALKKGDDYYWLWIGFHDDYNSLLE